MSSVLETRGLCKSFGALTVADQINFRLEAGSRHALIGPNGAGKTTFVNLLTGRLTPTSGQVWIGGQDVTALPQAERVRLGLGRTFQINSLFKKMSVLDNVALGVAERLKVADKLWQPARAFKAVRDESMALLEMLGIAADAGLRITDLPYGKQR